MLSILNKPLRVWHALAALGVVLALGVTGTAIAVQGKLNAISTRATYRTFLLSSLLHTARCTLRRLLSW